MAEYSVLLPIKPKYMAMIREGVKKYEIRKRLWTVNVKRIFFYESAPVKKVTAYMEYKGHEELPPSVLWARYGGALGLTEREFLESFGEVKKLYCIPIEGVLCIDPPLELGDIGLKRAPQSFRYISDDDVDLEGVL